MKLLHKGACVIRLGAKDYLPGDSIEVEELSVGLKILVAEGKLEVEDDHKATKEIEQEVKSKAKTKRQPKTIDEAENGGDYK